MHSSGLYCMKYVEDKLQLLDFVTFFFVLAIDF